MKSVVLDSVSKSYNGEIVLDQVSLEIEKQERLVLLGASGCGKTTILRLIAGFIEPDQGSIFIGKDLAARNGKNLKQPDQRNLGMVFQDLALWPHMTVKGNIEFGLKAKAISQVQQEEKIREALALVNLENFVDRKPGELSGGQQQRVALARVLVLEPSIILMDEPLSSLDTKLNIKLRNEIIQLQEKLQFTLVYVTHNEAEAEAIGTRTIWIKNHRILKKT